MGNCFATAAPVTNKSLETLDRFPQIQINMWRIHKHLYPLQAAKAGAKAKFFETLTNETAFRTLIEGYEQKAFAKSGIQNYLRGDYIKRIDQLLKHYHIQGVRMADDNPVAIQLVTTTISSASNGLSLPQATINVVSTAGFAKSGVVGITTTTGLWNIGYNGLTATSFTGVFLGGTGLLQTGAIVQQTAPGTDIYPSY